MEWTGAGVECQTPVPEVQGSILSWVAVRCDLDRVKKNKTKNKLKKQNPVCCYNISASLPEVLTSQTSSRANTPASSERSSSSRQKSKSKRKHKDRRRSDSRSRSRDRSRSRSRSKSRSKKKKRKRSPTPPSAYAVVRRYGLGIDASDLAQK